MEEWDCDVPGGQTGDWMSGDLEMGSQGEMDSA